MSTNMIVALMKKVSNRIEGAAADRERVEWLVFGAYFIVSYVLSLRGVEGLLLDLEGLLRHESKGNDSHFVVALLGKVKGEQHDRCHLLPCASITSSGIPVRMWVLAAMRAKEVAGLKDGPLVSHHDGRVCNTRDLDVKLIELLEEMFEEDYKLFPQLLVKEDILSSYSVYRTPRRSSDTRALEMKVAKTDIEIVNRWHTIERSKGNRPGFSMEQHYAQAELLLGPYLRYTSAM
jgi:hypothetical protein